MADLNYFRPGERIRRPDPSVIMRFLKKVWVSPCGCWKWTGAANGTGYGVFKIRIDDRGAALHAHRVGYAIFHGECPGGVTVDHICRNRLCVHPDHLQLLSLEEHGVKSNEDKKQDAQQNKQQDAENDPPF